MACLGRSPGSSAGRVFAAEESRGAQAFDHSVVEPQDRVPQSATEECDRTSVREKRGYRLYPLGVVHECDETSEAIVAEDSAALATHEACPSNGKMGRREETGAEDASCAREGGRALAADFPCACICLLG